MKKDAPVVGREKLMQWGGELRALPLSSRGSSFQPHGAAAYLLFL